MRTTRVNVASEEYGTNDLDLTHNPENLVLEEVDTVEFITQLMQDVLTNVINKVSRTEPSKLVDLNEIRPFPTLRPTQNSRRSRKKGRY